MLLTDIHIRDPFILRENGKYYMYGTRARNFGKKVGGFDVYTSTDLENWSVPHECFSSEKYDLNWDANWAPEVHRYKGAYYMFATFTREKAGFPKGMRGTYILKAEDPMGEFRPHSPRQVTPEDWECLDGTLYVDKTGQPYLVFCHEHTQVIDGTVCYMKLNHDLTEAAGDPVYMFSGSSPYWAEKKPAGEHYITDGPFMVRTKNGALIMLWSTIKEHQYYECLARSDNGEIDGHFEHLPPMLTSNGGHGMIFTGDRGLMFSYHTPNINGLEHAAISPLIDEGDTFRIVSNEEHGGIK